MEQEEADIQTAFYCRCNEIEHVWINVIMDVYFISGKQKMVILKLLELSLEQESTFFQIKKGLANIWMKAATLFFKNTGLKMIDKDTC